MLPRVCLERRAWALRRKGEGLKEQGGTSTSTTVVSGIFWLLATSLHAFAFAGLEFLCCVILRYHTRYLVFGYTHVVHRQMANVHQVPGTILMAIHRRRGTHHVHVSITYSSFFSCLK